LERQKRFIGVRGSILLLLVVAFLTAVWGLHLDLRVVRNSPQLTYIHWFGDRTLYENSVQGLTHKSLYSAYYVMLGVLGKIVPPVVVLYLMLFVTNLLAVFSVYWLTYVVSRRRAVAYAVVVLLLFNNPYSLGGSGTFIGNPTPGAFSISLCLFAIGLFLRQRYVAAFALLGVTANFYGSYAFYTAVAFATYYAVAFRGMDRKIIAKSLLACVACASPFLIWMLASGYAPGTGSLPFESWYTLVMYRSSGHVSPFSWSARTYLTFLPHAILLFLWRPTEKRSQIRDKLWAMSLGVLLLCIAGTVFVELLPVQQVIQFVLFRSTKLVMAFGIIAGATYLSEVWETRPLARWIGLGAAATLFLGRFELLYPALALLFAERFIAKRRWVDFSLGCVLLALSLYAWTVFRFSLDRRLFVVALGVGIVALLSQFKMRWTKPAAVGVVAALLVGMSPLGLYESYDEASLAYLRSLKETQLWIAENTPPEQLVMTPPQTRMWSGFSKRGVFMNYVDVAMPIYAPALGQEVVRRVDEYVGDTFGVIADGMNLSAAMQRAYDSWSEEDFRRIASEYGCSVAVVGATRTLALPVLHENVHFRVYAAGEAPLGASGDIGIPVRGGAERRIAAYDEGEG